MKAVLTVVIAAVVALSAYAYIRRASEARGLELVDRCQQMGERFANEIRKSDKETGIPLENRSFTYRAHYNTVEQKCFVLTEGYMSVPFGGGSVFLRQVWDVSAGVGAPDFAEHAIPVGKGNPTFYKAKQELPNSKETADWFDALMTR